MYKQRSVRILTKNHTAQPLRRAIFVPFKAICRLGSRTATTEVFDRSDRVIECNTVMSVDNSRDKLKMKECFHKGNVPQADMYWGSFSNPEAIKKHFGISVPEFQLVGKAICGFQGNGMVLITNDEELRAFCRSHTPQHFFIERYYNFSREYRLHATQREVFLSWRKLRKKDAEEKWFFNSHNCNWVGEQHGLFDKPTNWKRMCDAAVAAVRAVGLDIGAVDIRIQSAKSGSDPQFIVCEVNSAPALGDEGIVQYREQIKKILLKKYENDR